MAGHSKWHNIRRQKGAKDAQRGKIFMRHSRIIYQAAKEGGGDPDMNPRLRIAIDKAKADNMPNENIERAIKKATGTLEGVSFEEVTYEGYGPHGTAVIIHALTDNRNRSAAEIRHAFSKHGGNLGETGCVSFMFDRKGYIVIVDEEGKVDEDELSLLAIEAGADDIEVEEQIYEIYTQPEDFENVRSEIEAAGFDLEEAEVTLIPQTVTELDAEQEQEVLALIDALEEIDDVQDVHHNLSVSDE